MDAADVGPFAFFLLSHPSLTSAFVIISLSTYPSSSVNSNVVREVYYSFPQSSIPCHQFAVSAHCSPPSFPVLLGLDPPPWQCFSSEDHLVWRELAPTQAQANTNTMTPRASPPGIPRSAGAEYRGSFFSSSLDLEEPCLPQTEKPNQQQRHRRRGTPHRKESWDNNHRRARRPSSASGLASSSEDRGPLAPVERSRKRFSTGRAESTSCSPVRLRRGGMSATTATAEIRPARNEGLYARRRRSVVSAGGRRFGSGGGSEAEFARSSNTSRRGAAGRGVGSERLSGGMGFFSPSRDGGRVRLLR